MAEDRWLHVVAHEASATGSVQALAELLDWLSAHRRISLSVDIAATGPLADRLRALGPASPPTGGGPHPPVLLNTGVAVEIWAAGGPDPSIPLLVYLHEDGIAHRLTRAGRALLVRPSTRVLTVSLAVGAEAAAVGVPPGHITLLPPPIPPLTPPPRQGRRPSGPRIVAACSRAEWHKGPDLFVETLALMRARADVAGVWIGSVPRGPRRRLDILVDSAGLAGHMSWLGHQEDPAPSLAAADLILMPSRRDAQPSVPLQAALVGTPTVSFAVGGLRDFAAEGAVLAVPYPDTRSLAEAAISVLADPLSASGLVAAGREVAAGRTIELIGPRFATAVDEVLDSGR